MALLGVVSLLSLCLGRGGPATTYQPLGLTGGYSEVPLGGGSYLVRVVGNAYTPESLLWGHLRRRALELCAVERGFSSTRVEPRPQVVDGEVRAEVECRCGPALSDSGQGERTAGLLK